MSSLNQVHLIGHLGANPEMKSTQTGTSLCKLRIATSDRRKKGDEWVEHTEWHNIAVFGKSAENACKYLEKGSQVYIGGKLRTSQWETAEGQTRYSTEIVADELTFLSRRPQETR